MQSVRGHIKKLSEGGKTEQDGHSPHSQVHGSDNEEREGVDTNHDYQEHNVQHHLEEAWK